MISDSSSSFFFFVLFRSKNILRQSGPPRRAQKEHGETNRRRGEQSIRRHCEPTPLSCQRDKEGRRPHLPRIATTGRSVNSEEIKPYSQLFVNLVAPLYLWVLIWSCCCPAEHHSSVEESCVYVTRWTITEYYVPNSQCILLLLWAANCVRFRNLSHRTAGCGVCSALT